MLSRRIDLNPILISATIIDFVNLLLLTVKNENVDKVENRVSFII